MGDRWIAALIGLIIAFESVRFDIVQKIYKKDENIDFKKDAYPL